ncbi:MAG: hypothetical protein ACFFFH_16360 [Candidatus Thorarchaeota archaeon]
MVGWSLLKGQSFLLVLILAIPLGGGILIRFLLLERWDDQPLPLPRRNRNVFHNSGDFLGPHSHIEFSQIWKDHESIHIDGNDEFNMYAQSNG